MVIPCDKCGALNPATNRFCGQCGSHMLSSPAAGAPEESWRDPASRESKPLEASADLPPEIIEFDNQIPLIADEGEDRRIHPPSELVSRAHDHLEREAELHDQLHHATETHYEARAREDAARSLSFADSENAARTGISGPSFLGLSDDQAPDYLLEDDEPPESHMRRNVALAVVAAALVLVAVQWRSVRDYGVAYIQNGSMQVKPRSKDAPQNPPAVAADNTDRDQGLPPASATTSSPQPLQSSPNADRSAQAANPSASQSSTSATSQPSSDATGSASVTLQVPRPAASAMSAPSPDVPSNVPSDNAAADNVSAATRQAEEKPPTRILVRPSPPPGADEMNRAAHASDSEARAAWLWRAVGKGNPQAPVELARMYEQGNGVARSCDQAQVLLRSAAAKGNEQAKISLQQMRIRGDCSGR